MDIAVRICTDNPFIKKNGVDSQFFCSLDEYIKKRGHKGVYFVSG